MFQKQSEKDIEMKYKIKAYKKRHFENMRRIEESEEDNSSPVRFTNINKNENENRDRNENFNFENSGGESNYEKKNNFIRFKINFWALNCFSNFLSIPYVRTDNGKHKTPAEVMIEKKEEEKFENQKCHFISSVLLSLPLHYLIQPSYSSSSSSIPISFMQFSNERLIPYFPCEIENIQKHGKNHFDENKSENSVNFVCQELFKINSNEKNSNEKRFNEECKEKEFQPQEETIKNI